MQTLQGNVEVMQPESKLRERAGVAPAHNNEAWSPLRQSSLSAINLLAVGLLFSAALTLTPVAQARDDSEPDGTSIPVGASNAAAQLDQTQLAQTGAKRARDALQRGNFSQAIAEYENLNDRGFSGPGLVVNRAAAYLGRASSASARPGDLGQAAAALEEAIIRDPSDQEAAAALERVRQEISRRRAQAGADPIVMGPPLGRAVVGLLSENTWAVVALIGSLLLSMGIAIRLWLRRVGANISAALAAFAGLFLLVVGAGMAGFAQHFRTTSNPAVVIVDQARLLNDRGLPADAEALRLQYSAVPEGAKLYVLQRRGALAQVLWGNNVAWVQSTSLRTLTEP